MDTSSDDEDSNYEDNFSKHFRKQLCVSKKPHLLNQIINSPEKSSALDHHVGRSDFENYINSDIKLAAVFRSTFKPSISRKCS
jgi:hypothetical protein